MDPLYILLGSLSVWRITHLFQAEDGSFNLIYSIRKLAGNSFFGTLLDRFYCLSIWVSLPFAIWLGNTLAEIFLLLTSFSGIACLLEKFSTIKNNN